jgi:transcriptional regulator CtsR
MSDEPTKAQIGAAIEMLVVVGALIRDVCRGRKTQRVPAGELYARLSDKMSSETFNQIVQKLVEAKLVTRKFHELRWIGPDGPTPV